MSDRPIESISAIAKARLHAHSASGAVGALPSPPDSGDLAVFQQTLRSLQSPVGNAGKVTTDPSLLGELSNYLSARRSMAANQLTGVLNTRDPAALIEVSREMSDQAIEQDLLVKVIGKTVSSIDQLTKLN
jgi:hypothetical protein